MNALTTQATTTAPTIRRKSMLLDIQMFDHMQRAAKVLALSPLFPEHLRKGSIETAIANGILVLNMADRLNEDELTVAQNIYFVSGKPGWATTYMIAKANQHGVFKDVIDWDVSGSGETLAVTAFGILASTGKRVAVTCDMDMAKKEGWTKNSKYQSMPEQMLRYRSAAFLIRLYCPEVMIGIPAQVELEMEVKDVTPFSEPATVKANAEAPIEAKPVKATEERKTAPTPANEAKKPASQEAKEADPGPTEIVDEETGEVVEEAGAKAVEAPDRERFEHLAAMIVADVQGGMTRTDMDELYGPQIDAITTHFPDLKEAINTAVIAAGI